jgi:hypothetical protein
MKDKSMSYLDYTKSAAKSLGWEVKDIEGYLRDYVNEITQGNPCSEIALPGTYETTIERTVQDEPDNSALLLM